MNSKRVIERLVVSRQLPSVEFFRVLILEGVFALLELHRMATVTADSRKILPQSDHVQPRNL